jgi:hypothetical protein
MTNQSAAGPRIIAFQVAISICARLAEGKSLRAICSEAGMPGRATVFRWIARHKEFRDEYTLACELRAEDLADEMIEIADDPYVWVEKKEAGTAGAGIETFGTQSRRWRLLLIEQRQSVHISRHPAKGYVEFQPAGTRRWNP